MKIKPEHYAELERIFLGARPLAEPLAEYLKAGNSAKRWRWDVLYLAKASNWICQNLYPYLNDDHIDTALRRIVASQHPLNTK